MEQHRLETTDIFRGAFFLCQGGRLTNVRVKDDARRIVSFLFELEDIAQVDSEYRRGYALVNPVEFRESLNQLRDILFDKLRDPASHKSYAEARRGERYDRERENRGDQKER